MTNKSYLGRPAKHCLICHVFKSLDDYHFNRTNKDRKDSRCKECAKHAVYASRATNNPCIKEYDRKRAQAKRDAKKKNIDFLN